MEDLVRFAVFMAPFVVVFLLGRLYQFIVFAFMLNAIVKKIGMSFGISHELIIEKLKQP